MTMLQNYIRVLLAKKFTTWTEMHAVVCMLSRLPMDRRWNRQVLCYCLLLKLMQHN